jgi:hypothetical protein
LIQSIYAQWRSSSLSEPEVLVPSYIVGAVGVAYLLDKGHDFFYAPYGWQGVVPSRYEVHKRHWHSKYLDVKLKYKSSRSTFRSLARTPFGQATKRGLSKFQLFQNTYAAWEIGQALNSVPGWKPGLEAAAEETYVQTNYALWGLLDYLYD